MTQTRARGCVGTRKRVILLAGGVFHSILVWQGLIGAFTLVVALRARYWEIERESIDDGLWMMALLVVAAGFGWFCMRLVRAPHPWRSELGGLAVAIASFVVIGVVSAFVWHAIRADYTAASFWSVGVFVVGILVGATSFYLIGRHSVRSGSRPTERATPELT